MSPGNGKGRPRQGDPTPSNVQNLDNEQGTPTKGQKPVTTVLAMAQSVIGGTGRQRWLLIFRCLLCGCQHVAHGRGELPTHLDRPAACGRGRIRILPVLGRLRGVA